MVRMIVALALLMPVGACSKSSSGHGEASPPPEAAQATATTAPTQVELDDAAWMAQNAARLLAQAFRSVGLAPRHDGSSVTVGKSTLEVNVVINNRLEKDGQHILAAETHVAIDGSPVPALRAGAIGIDSTAAGARQTAVSEWAGQYGAPIAFALAAREGAGPPDTAEGIANFYARLEVDDVTLYHGPPGLRGEAKDPASVSSRELVKQIARVVASHLGDQQPIRTATIQLVVRGSRVADGECRVNGDVSPALQAALARLSWPEAAPTYMYKQFFVAAD